MLNNTISFLALLVISTTLSANEITLNTETSTPLSTPDLNGFLDHVATHAFKKIGIKLSTVNLPAERALKSSNSGLIDGELTRIKGMDKLYPNLIRVPEKIIDMQFVAFSIKPIILTQGWKSLADYSVGFINGWKIYERNVPVQSDITKVRTAEQLFAILLKKRVDLILYERWGGLLYIKNHNQKNIHLLSPPLAEKEMFIYLHKKHKKLVPLLNNALKQMKADGTYKKIFNKKLKPLE